MIVSAHDDREAKQACENYETTNQFQAPKMGHKRSEISITPPKAAQTKMSRFSH